MRKTLNWLLVATLALGYAHTMAAAKQPADEQAREQAAKAIIRQEEKEGLIKLHPTKPVHAPGLLKQLVSGSKPAASTQPPDEQAREAAAKAAIRQEEKEGLLKLPSKPSILPAFGKVTAPGAKPYTSRQSADEQAREAQAKEVIRAEEREGLIKLSKKKPVTPAANSQQKK